VANGGGVLSGLPGGGDRRRRLSPGRSTRVLNNQGAGDAVRTRTKFVLSAAAMAVTACGSSSAKSTATSSPALTPSAAVSAAPALNVTATAEDYTGKPAPAGAVVMTMAALLFNPPVPAGMGTKIVIYIDNKDPDGHDCERFGGPPGSNICYQHGLLVLGPEEQSSARRTRCRLATRRCSHLMGCGPENTSSIALW